MSWFYHLSDLDKFIIIINLLLHSLAGSRGNMGKYSALWFCSVPRAQANTVTLELNISTYSLPCFAIMISISDVNGFQSMEDLKMLSVDGVEELDGLIKARRKNKSKTISYGFTTASR